MGYNIFRDEVWLDYIEYDGEDTTYYWDLNIVWPGCYDYYITALYDLDLCGMPGDSAESEGSIVKTVCIDLSGCHLPFIETWNTGSFDPNLWTAEEDWSVSGDYGNPLPCALFDGSQVDSNYSQRLTSYYHNCREHPGTGNPYIDGDIYLEFDIKLNDLDTCGIDRMLVQYTDSTMEYQTIVEFSDTAGSFPWKHHKINLTSEVKWKMIKIAFLAEGEEGSIININNWYIDNIELYRTCNPPRNLQWVVFDEVMAWHPPLPHTIVKDQDIRELQGYNIYYYDNGTTFLDFTTDTFYVLNQSYGFGPYYVTAVYEDCEPASNEIFGPVSISEKNSKTEINIYPNPVDKLLTISSTATISQIRILDINGKVMTDKSPNNKKFQLSTASIPNGIYIVETKISTKLFRQKIIVQH